MLLKTIRRRFSGLLVVAVLTVVPVVSLADAPAPAKQQAGFEVEFLTGMIDHHAMAVMMAELCPDRAVHEELRSLCEQIMTTQIHEIELMQSWLQDWYGLSYEPRMRPRDQKMIDRLAQLVGADFEIAFMEMMIRHHEAAVREGLRCIDRAYHEELIELCENIVQTQSEEIAIMEMRLCDWYSICD